MESHLKVAVDISLKSVIGARLKIRELYSQPVFILAVLAYRHDTAEQPQTALVVRKARQCHPHMNSDPVSCIGLRTVGGDPAHGWPVAQDLHAGQGNIDGDGWKNAAIRLHDAYGMFNGYSAKGALFLLH